MTPEELHRLVDHLRSMPRETEWVEFKENNADPKEIGECLAALSNGAALHRQAQAFAVWGIEDETHDLVGTTFRPRDAKVGNEEVENWWLRLLTPRIEFRIHEGDANGKRVVLMEIQPATHQPVSFSGIEYIRVGSYKKKLKDFPEKERALWAIFSERPFEGCVAAASVGSDDVLTLIDYTTCFRLLGLPLPDNRLSILERLASEQVIISQPGDRFDITNVGAVLFAADISRFDRLARKAARVVIYKGDNRTHTIKEHPNPGRDVPRPGYAVGFEALIAWINDQLPQNEEIGQALRRQVRMYPEVAIRELVANALIHQDFNLTGTGPMIELFSDRLEITNPGLPLVDPLRFIDEPPRSRNERLAGLMRRMDLCEERGSGIDKVIEAVEKFQLPAPDFRTTTQHTIAVLLGPRDFSRMRSQDRVRACYQHACLWHLSGRQMTNASLRERLKIAKSNYPLASRIIRDAIDAGFLKPVAGIGKEHGYVPFWA
ncbi:MAG TPA: ATP-binding protein [Nitrospirales bacterium]